VSLRPYQQEAHDAVIKWVKSSTEPCLIDAATGCHDARANVIMHDLSIKNITEIKVGDKLMSPTGGFRTVLSLHRGIDEMFFVSPTKGEGFTVNKGHIFNLRNSGDKLYGQQRYENVSVAEYINLNKTKKHIAKLHRGKISYSTERNLSLPPYTLGVLIGDGCLRSETPTFCVPDVDIIKAVKNEVVDSFDGMTVNYKYVERKHAYHCSIKALNPSRSNKNAVSNVLRVIGEYGKLAQDKFVPFEYMAGSLNQRLDMLAGLIDTDGSLSKCGYDWISKSEQLADDVVWLCRSVGLAAYKKECIKSCQNNFSATYFRVSISGDCSIIPNRCKRKKAPARQQKKRVDVTGFKIESVGKGSYFGIELDGDKLYMTDDFIVHHNSGKSHIVAAIAETIHKASGGKRILCIQPSGELVKQNHAKYLQTGSPASIYSASLGKKCLRHPVIFATPMSIKNVVEKHGNFIKQFAMIIIDEAHGITPTIKRIIRSMRLFSPNVRIVGLTATPYRMGDGYIYKNNQHAGHIEEEARNPFFHSLVYKIGAHKLISDGYLTQPKIGEINANGYDTSGLQLNSMGKFKKDGIDKAFIGHGRKTASIVADVIEKSRLRNGVMFFAATVQHAHEILASLPDELSALVTGETNKGERANILRRFLAREIKYLVNISVLTTGFDAPHVDVVAILRATESVGLLQQIIGRGLRLHDEKSDCLILDYAENIDRHCPDGDIFNPEIKAFKSKEKGVLIDAECEDCGFVNKFTARKNDEEYPIDANGYYTDLDGVRIQNEVVKGVFVPMPAHFGRRCTALFGEKTAHEVQCAYRWSHKKCEQCEAENDIAARYCSECKAEIIDPNEKLIADFKAMKKDPHQVQCDKIIEIKEMPTVSKTGREIIVLSITTEYRSFKIYLQPQSAIPRCKVEHSLWMKHRPYPQTITYKKQHEKQFYNLIDFNDKADEVGV